LVNLKFRTATSGDEPFLREMLYLALFVPPGAPPIPRSLLNDPALARYVQHCGTRPGDSGLIALVDDSSVGAAWLRQFPITDPAKAFVDESTPELSIALLPACRPYLRFGFQPLANSWTMLRPLGLIVLRCCS
jgi:hypothetical protein